MSPFYADNLVTLLNADARDGLATLPDASVDCVVTDPPYPEIDRPYGRLTEAEWHALMDAVVPECRRILKPAGSAVFVLQPNSERVGRMRPWLWEFMAKWTREWGMVQDAWWWNFAAFPNGGCNTMGMMRGSLKACVWLGSDNCYRNQTAVLWTESERQKVLRITERVERRTYPSGNQKDNQRMYAAAERRGGVTPFNVLPFPNTRIDREGHGAGTPDELCDWWLRYICPPSGVVCDPFVGSGTVAIQAALMGNKCVGIERDAGYVATAARRCRKATRQMVMAFPAAEPIGGAA